MGPTPNLSPPGPPLAGLQKALYLFHKLIHVLELAVDRGEPDVRHLVYRQFKDAEWDQLPT